MCAPSEDLIHQKRCSGSFLSFDSISRGGQSLALPPLTFCESSKKQNRVFKFVKKIDSFSFSFWSVF